MPIQSQRNENNRRRTRHADAVRLLRPADSTWQLFSLRVRAAAALSGDALIQSFPFHEKIKVEVYHGCQALCIHVCGEQERTQTSRNIEETLPLFLPARACCSRTERQPQHRGPRGSGERPTTFFTG